MEPSPIRVRYALIIALVGLLIPGGLVLLLKGTTTWSAAELTSLAGLFTSVVGTLVGAFLGVQVAAAGTQQAQQQAAAANQRADQAQQQAAEATQRATEANANAARAIQQLAPDKQAEFRRGSTQQAFD